jgi:hypothetical protein
MIRGTPSDYLCDHVADDGVKFRDCGLAGKSGSGTRILGGVEPVAETSFPYKTEAFTAERLSGGQAGAGDAICSGPQNIMDQPAEGINK